MSAAEPGLERLRRRRDFLRVAGGGRKCVTPGLVLQARPRRHDDSRTIRVGFTASRKVGGAVARNRARRKLKALARELLPGLGRPGYDYVLIARAATVRRPHAELSRDLRGALTRIMKETGARSAA